MYVVAPVAVPVKRKRKAAPPRRFERSRPGDLWQTDITYLDVPWQKSPLYLIAYLDDFSRYVVGHGLFTHQRGDIAVDVFREACARFGKPKEVLTDQGRQYFAWRGKTEFQKLLAKEGVAHVVARAHHPMTVGLCGAPHKPSYADVRVMPTSSHGSPPFACLHTLRSRLPATEVRIITGPRGTREGDP